MNGTAISSPIIPGKLDEWKKFSKDLNDGPKHSEYIAFIKKCGLSRVRCWLQESPAGPSAIILYEGETPGEFFRQVGTSTEPFVLWFRERIKELNGMDLSKPMGSPPELVTDARVPPQ